MKSSCILQRGQPPAVIAEGEGLLPSRPRIDPRDFTAVDRFPNTHDPILSHCRRDRAVALHRCQRDVPMIQCRERSDLPGIDDLDSLARSDDKAAIIAGKLEIGCDLWLEHGLECARGT